MTTDNHATAIPLPGILTGQELIGLFCDASNIQQNPDIRWRFGKKEFTPGVYCGGHHYFHVYSRPLFREVPNTFKRHVLGKKFETWSPRTRMLTIADSEATVFLSDRDCRWQICAEERYYDQVYLDVRLDLRDGGSLNLKSSDPNHPMFQEYRAGFEMIRANFLTNLIEFANKNATMLAERDRAASRWTEPLLLGHPSEWQEHKYAI